MYLNYWELRGLRFDLVGAVTQKKAWCSKSGHLLTDAEIVLLCVMLSILPKKPVHLDTTATAHMLPSNRTETPLSKAGRLMTRFDLMVDFLSVHTVHARNARNQPNPLSRYPSSWSLPPRAGITAIHCLE